LGPDSQSFQFHKLERETIMPRISLMERISMSGLIRAAGLIALASIASLCTIPTAAQSYISNVLHDLSGSAEDGANPFAGSVMDANGNHYGTTNKSGGVW
jgi:hypothetical protein